jgi:hypothetical protein
MRVDRRARQDPMELTGTLDKDATGAESDVADGRDVL